MKPKEAKLLVPALLGFVLCCLLIICIPICKESKLISEKNVESFYSIMVVVV